MLHKLKSQSKDQESQSSTHTVEDAIENTAGVDFGPKIETKSASKETKSTTATETAKVFMNEKLLALEGLKSSAKLLIIDDFHYIEPDLQKVIVRSLKAAIFEGAKVIVLSVPHRSEDIPRQESEMTGRVSKLAVPIWSADELKEIARLGFKALNLLASDALLDRMTQESYGSPQLMQEFCLKICEHNGILAKKDFSFMLVEPNYDTFFKKSAEELASKVAFEKLSRGPRQRTDRLQRKLQEQDREVDLY